MSLAACFGAASANATDRYTLSDNNGNAVDVVEYTTADFKEDFIAAYERKTAAYSASITWEDSYKSLLREEAQEFNLAARHVDVYAEYIGNQRFKEDVGYTGIKSIRHGPSALAVMPRLRISDQEMAEVCFINNYRPEDMNVVQWALSETKKVLNIQGPGSENYSMYTYEMIRFHEQAHCMGADEPEADYAATLLMMDKYAGEDAESITAFLNFYADLRSYSYERQSHEQRDDLDKVALYKYCSNSIRQALSDYADSAQKPNEQDVWSMITGGDLPQKLHNDQNYTSQQSAAIQRIQSLTS
jgi:hypothetical protein